MALPTTINSASPAGSDPPQVAAAIRALKLAIVDLFGLPDATSIAAAGFTFTADGLQIVAFQDTAADPSVAGHLQRNGTALKLHDGTTVRTLYIAGGTDVAVTDGGTGLSSGTSGAVLYYSAAATLASSGELAAHAPVFGGGAGTAPHTTPGVGTNGQLLIGRTGLDAVWAAISNGGNITATGGAGSLTLAAVDRVILNCWGTAVATGTHYLAATHSATEAAVQWSSPVTGTVKAIYSHASAAGNYTYTLRVNGSDTAITHTTSSAADGSSTGSAAVTAGQAISVKISGSTGQNHQVQVAIEATA